MMRFCFLSGLATELLDADATARLPALFAWPQKSWQRWRSEKFTKIQLSQYCFDYKKNSSLPFYPFYMIYLYQLLLKSRYSRLISGVMTITPLFSLWCRISWWSNPYCSQGSESVAWHENKSQHRTSRNPSQRQRSELLKAASANATKFQWPKCLCPCRGSCYTHQKIALCKNDSNTGNQKFTTKYKID